MFYKLENKNPVKCVTGQEWVEWYEAAARSGERVVARDTFSGVLLSTIFTGIDPNSIDADPPQLFETVAFMGRKATGVALRSATWEQAEQTHRSMLRKMRKERGDGE